VWQIERQLTPSLQTSAAARNLTAGWLGEVLDDTTEDTARAVDEATLIVSELVTNAVQAHTQELRLSLRVELNDPSMLTIAVADDAPGEPTLSSGPLTRTHGRGLLLVDALAQRWGTKWADEYKSVWAELTIPAARPWPETG
jgi:two-component sensor histidine kinase